MAHEMRAVRWGMRVWARGVREYSTLGGISAWMWRETRPEASRFLRVSVSTLGEMSGMARPMALKRVAWFSESTQSISIDHLPVKRERTLRTGQVSMRVYFFRFSCRGNAFIFKITYLRVIVLRFGNLLHYKDLTANFALSKRKRLSIAKLIIILKIHK